MRRGTPAPRMRVRLRSRHESNAFTPIQLGKIALQNRVVMAPMTRNRADADGTPTDIMAEHYGPAR